MRVQHDIESGWRRVASGDGAGFAAVKRDFLYAQHGMQASTEFVDDEKSGGRPKYGLWNTAAGLHGVNFGG